MFSRREPSVGDTLQARPIWSAMPAADLARIHVEPLLFGDLGLREGDDLVGLDRVQRGLDLLGHGDPVDPGRVAGRVRVERQPTQACQHILQPQRYLVPAGLTGRVGNRRCGHTQNATGGH